MRLVSAIATGLVLWIVIWAITDRGFDAMMAFVAVLVIAATLEIVVRYLPSRD